MTIIWLARWNEERNEYDMCPIVREKFLEAMQQAANMAKTGWFIYKGLMCQDLTIKEWFKFRKEERRYESVYC